MPRAEGQITVKPVSMAGSAAVLEDGSLISRWDRQLLRLERVMALISGLAVFSLMVLAVVSVGGRNAFNAPLPGYVDWIEQVMPLIAFMKGHLCSDALTANQFEKLLMLIESGSIVISGLKKRGINRDLLCFGTFGTAWRGHQLR